MDCETITVDIQSNEQEIDFVTALVGGIIGGILGLVVGAIVTKCFLLRCLQRRIDRYNQKQTELVAISEHPSTDVKVAPTSFQTTVTLESSDTKCCGGLVENENGKTAAVQEFHLSESWRQSLADILVTPAVDLRVRTTSKQETNAFTQCSISAWKHRHTCMLQTFKIILTQYFMNEQLGAEDYTKMLAKAEEDMRRSLNRYQRSCGLAMEGDTSDDLLPPPHTSKTVELVQLHHRCLLVVQACHSAQQSFTESLRSRRSYVETMLQRLTKTGRLQKDVVVDLWKIFREKLEGCFDQVEIETQSALTMMQNDFLNLRIKIFGGLESERNTAVQKVLDKKSSNSKISQFIESYFDVIFRFREKEIAALQETLNSEAALLAQLPKKGKLTLQTRGDEAIEQLCTSLVESNALTVEEAETVLAEICLKFKKADEKSSRMNQTQTRLVEREAGACRSLTTQDGDDDDDGKVRGSVLRNARDDICRCLNKQCLMSDSDRKCVIDEYEVAASLLKSQAFVTRVMTYRRLDVELLGRQLKLIDFARGGQKFETDEDIQAALGRIDELKAEHMKKHNFRYRSAGAGLLSELLDAEVPHVCTIIARTLMDKLAAEEKSRSRSDRAMDCVKRMIIGHVNDLGKLDSQSRDVLCDEHREDVDLLEKRLRHEYDVQVQMNKERSGAKHRSLVAKLLERDAELMKARPQSAQQFSVADVLDRMLEQGRNQRKIEILEREADVEGADQVFLQRLDLDRRLHVALQDLDRVFLCKVAVTAGMKKSTFLDLVQKALQIASLSRNDVKNWSNAFAQNWRKVKGKTLDEPFALGPSGESTPNRLPPITTKRRRGGKSFLARQAQRQAQA